MQKGTVSSARLRCPFPNCVAASLGEGLGPNSRASINLERTLLAGVFGRTDVSRRFDHGNSNMNVRALAFSDI